MVPAAVGVAAVAFATTFGTSRGFGAATAPGAGSAASERAAAAPSSAGSGSAAASAPGTPAPAREPAEQAATTNGESGSGEAGAPGQGRLSRSEVPATGHQEAILAVERFGRYSLRAASRQGTALRVVDRMAGELGAAGEAGRENGRLDLLLDRGEYKVAAESDEHGEGTAKLSVEPFRDSRAGASAASSARGAAPSLVENKLVQDSLDDLRQLSWWLQLTARREVRLEAAGRNLADLRLWRDGSWLEEAAPSCAPIQPVTGQPLLRCEVAATLPAGLYLLVAYGGPPQPWSEQAAEHPLYLRWGYPRLPDAGRRRYQIGPFGEDRFALPDNVNYLRIELPQARPAQLAAGWVQPGALLATLAAAGPDVAAAEVRKDSLPPVAEVRVPAKPSAGDASERQTRRRSPRRGRAAPAATPVAPATPAITAEEDEAEGGSDMEETPLEGGAGSLPASAGGPGSETGAAQAADAAGAAQAGAAMPAGDETQAESGAGARATAGAGDAGGQPPATLPGDEEMEAAAVANEPATSEPAGAAGAESGEGGMPAAAEASPEEETPAAESAGGKAGEAPGEQAAAQAGGGEPATAPQLWISVRGAPGQPYVLQHFERRNVYAIRTQGRRWISTVQSGDPRDSVDATAILTSRPVDGSERERTDASAAVPIDSRHAWARRFNLLARLELFLEVGERGRYEVVSAGGGRFRIEPFLTSRPVNYKAPPFKPGGSRWDLDPGLYVLTAEPLRRGGVVTLGVRPAGKFDTLLREAAATGVERDPVRASARLAPTPLDPDRRYTLYLNLQPGVAAGTVLRPWPVDLDQPLPLTQRPGEPLALDFTAAAAGTLRAETDDGQLLETAVDGGPWQTAAAVAAGVHHLEVRNPAGAAGARTVSYSLWVEPAALAAAAPLPPPPAAALAELPRFPALSPGSPRFLDLARGSSATFLVEAGNPGLYQLQTTGVLATAATLRTRTVTSLAAGRANGVGRNALVRQYLRVGDFQATVTAIGRSQGHLGVELLTTPLLDGGELRLDAPARITLAAGQAVVYRFAIAEKGDYRLLAMGLGFVYTCRLEDAGGWPVAPPNLAADISRKLAPGSYRLVLLPQPIAGRAVTLLTRKRELLRFAGHGPHPLPLGRAVEHLWREPETATQEPLPQQRPPDLWRFDLPAAARTTIALDSEMEGTVARLDGGDGGGGAQTPTELGHVPPGRSVTLQLEAGRYQVAVVCSRRNSLVRYKVRVATAELVDGQERLVEAPATLPVAVAGGGLVEISSYSASDVRARLYGPGGGLVADEDDRPDDWNFLISQRLPAGRYRLEIEPVGRASAKLRVAMRTLAEIEDKPLALPFRGGVELAAQVRLLPLSLSAQADLLVVAARSQENLGLGLERRAGNGWRLIGSSTGREPRLELPLSGAPAALAGAYRLRLWSLERGGAPADLAVAAVTVPRISERQLARGAALPPLHGIAPPLAPLAAAVVDLARPGLVRVHAGGQAPLDSGRTDPQGTGQGRQAQEEAQVAGAGEAGTVWRGGSVAGEVLAPFSGGGVTFATPTGGRGHLWLVVEASRGSAPRLRGERIELAPGFDAAVAFGLPPSPAAVVTCDLAPRSAGGRGRDRRPGPVLVLATAPAGQPAVMIGERGQAPARRLAATLAVSPRSAVSVALAPRQPVAWVWDGDLQEAPAPSEECRRATLVSRPWPREAAPAEPASVRGAAAPDLRLAQLSFPAPPVERADWGVAGGSMAGLSARQFELPPGAKKVRLSMGAALVAVLSEGDAVAGVHWQGGLPFEELLDGSATRLTLLHLRDGADPFTFELLPRAAGEDELALPLSAPFARSFDRAGTLRLRLPGREASGGGQPGAGLRRYQVFFGATGSAAGEGQGRVAADAVLLDDEGGVGRAAAAPDTGSQPLALAGSPGGFLLIRHGPGVVLAWAAGLLDLGEAGVGGGGAGWQAPLAAPAQQVSPPATVALAGRFTHLAVSLREPAVLHVRAGTPALSLLSRPVQAAGQSMPRDAAQAAEPGSGRGAGQATTRAAPTGSAPPPSGEAAEIHASGVRLDAYLPAGVSHLGFGALGESELGGFAELTTTPVLPTGEGLGPEVLLPAGDTRYFAFHVTDRRLVGWGAAAAAERVSCRLLGADGHPATRRSPAAGKPAAFSGLTDMLEMGELDAGDYLLALVAPPDAAPLRVRPVVVGLAPPDTGPPPEVIRKYMQEAGAFVPAAAPGSRP
jgi:hypothetical protein